MRSADPALVTLLNSMQPLAMADLYTITLLGGGLLRYTSADVPVTLGATTWARGPLLTRSKTRQSVGISVDTLDITLAADASVLVSGNPILTLIAQGGLRGARLTLERAFAANWASAWVGSIIMFAGRVSVPAMDRYQARLSVRSDLELLDAMVPRNLYQPGCMNTLYDAACGKDRAALTVANAVTASPAPTKTVFDTTLAQAAQYFDLGVVTFTSGANNGIARTVKSFAAGGLVTLIAPLPFAPAAGDTLTIYPGCDKTMATCTARFANLVRFRGQPYVPVPETVT